MKFQIKFTPGAEEDIEYFRVREQRIIIDGIKRLLSENANIPTKRRKELRANELAPWALKLGDYRIFYDIEGNNLVKVIAIGYKEHNDLYIRGKRVRI